MNDAAMPPDPERNCLRARLAGLRMLLHARRLRVMAGVGADASRANDLVQPVLAEIAEVKERLHSLGVPVSPSPQS